MKHKCDGLLLVLVTLLSFTATSKAQHNPRVGAWQGSGNVMGVPTSGVLVMTGDYRFRVQYLASLRSLGPGLDRNPR